MSYKDITIICRDCGKPFIFSAGEQEFYAQKGFLNEPTRCPECRRARKHSRQPGQPNHTARQSLEQRSNDE